MKSHGLAASNANTAPIPMATVTFQPGVARTIDLAHPAGADDRVDFVGTEARAGTQGHMGN